MDWDDLRFVLAVCRAGSAQQAARVLGVNQTTVTRRVAQLEAALQAELFDRRPAGYVPTPHGEQVARAAEAVEQTVRALEHALAAERRALTGTVRITTSEALANGLVAPNLADFRKAHPQVAVQLVIDDRALNIAAGEADVALRASAQPQEAGIVFRRMPDTNWAIYCSHGYAAEHGKPQARTDIAQHSVVGMAAAMAEIPPVRWVEGAANEATITMRCTSLTALVPHLRAGLGIAALPCFVGDREPELTRCLSMPSELTSGLWLVVREDVKSAPHVRAFVDYLAARLQALRRVLAGE